MQKRIFFKLFLTAAFAVFVLANSSMGSQRDALVEKLVEKGILTEKEAQEIMVEIRQEEVKKEEAKKEEIESGVFEIPEWVKRTEFHGDLRLRYDTQWRREKEVGGTEKRYKRNRERFRLRFGIKSKVTDTTEVGVRLASGSGYQNTTNQSFDEHGRGKEIFIDRAYATWKPTKFIKITGGKHKNPLFTAPLVWDPDVNPEGVSESFKYGLNDNIELFGTLGQWFIEELDLKDESNSDPWVFISQIGFTIKPVKNIKFELAFTYYNFQELDELEWGSSVLSDKSEFLGYNHKHNQQMIFDAAGKLLNEFECFEVGAKLGVKKLLPVPVAIFGSLIKNEDADIDRLIREGVDTGDSDPALLLRYSGDDRDVGWQVGMSIGNKKKKGDWHVKYFYQELEDYAFPAVFVDSDFHGGGTNNKGHYLHGRYLLTDNIQLRASGFFTEREDEQKDGNKDEDRIQLDVVFKF